MKRYLESLILLFGLFLCSTVGQAQDHSYLPVMTRMQNVINNIDVGYQSKHQKFYASLRRYDHEAIGHYIQKARDFSSFIYSAQNTIPFSQEFARSLEYDVSSCEKYLRAVALNATEGRVVSWNIVQEFSLAVWNLELKSRVIRTNNTERVKVTVNTLNQNGNAVHNCRVWFAPYHRDAPEHRETFDRLSTPTEHPIPPGKYNFWAVKNGQQGSKTHHNIGDDGLSTRNIDIEAP